MKNKTRFAWRLLSGLALAGSITGCLPAFLEKYRKEGQNNHSSEAPRAEAAVDPVMQTEPYPQGAARQALPESAPRATIYAVDKHTYHFDLRDSEVWETALDVLMRNYNLTIVDRQSGIVTTEWDSYFLDRAVYRNRVSMRMTRSSRGGVDVIIHNNVERLRDASRATETVGAVWLPADDPAQEGTRIVQNMALLLNQPPPIVPPNANVARQLDPLNDETKL